jgi:predicted tellurium resistance membrane protein TerC
VRSKALLASGGGGGYGSRRACGIAVRQSAQDVDAEQHEHDADAQFEDVRQSVGFVIETSDIVFALDSVPAVHSVTGPWMLGLLRQACAISL